jgi:curved DNA-binding protein CbpA
MKKTLYDFLGVNSQASTEEIKKAAYALIKQNYPLKDNPSIAARIEKIKLIYNTLSDPNKRAAYDAELAKRTSPAAPAPAPQPNNVSMSTPLVEEAFIYKISIHWFGYFLGLLLIISSVYLLFIKYNSYYIYLIMLIGIIIFIKTLIQQLTTSLVLTSNRMIAKSGLISKKNIEIIYDDFEDFTITQGTLGKIFGFGTVKIKGVQAKDTIKITNVAALKKFEKRLIRLIKQSAYHQI